MTSFQLTPQAVDDLLEIWSYIGEENPASASRVEESILAPAGLSQNRLSSERSYPSSRSESKQGGGTSRANDLRSERSRECGVEIRQAQF